MFLGQVTETNEEEPIAKLQRSETEETVINEEPETKEKVNNDEAMNELISKTETLPLVNSKSNYKSQNINKAFNTTCQPRPRNQCDGGTKQLKHKNDTIRGLSNEEKKRRTLRVVSEKLGQDTADAFLASWKVLIENRAKKTDKEVKAEGDGQIQGLLNLGFSKGQVTTFLGVGGYRLNRIMKERKNPGAAKGKNKPKKVGHAASNEDCEIHLV